MGHRGQGAARGLREAAHAGRSPPRSARVRRCPPGAHRRFAGRPQERPAGPAPPGWPAARRTRGPPPRRRHRGVVARACRTLPTDRRATHRRAVAPGRWTHRTDPAAPVRRSPSISRMSLRSRGRSVHGRRERPQYLPAPPSRRPRPPASTTASKTTRVPGAGLSALVASPPDLPPDSATGRTSEIAVKMSIPLTMSITASAATATPVRACISTPVRSAVRTVTLTWTLPG